MIAKISSSENLAGALGYNFKKVVSGEASVLLAEGLYAPPPDSAYALLEVLSDMQALIPPKYRTI
jgi:putative mobilization protein